MANPPTEATFAVPAMGGTAGRLATPEEPSTEELLAAVDAARQTLSTRLRKTVNALAGRRNLTVQLLWSPTRAPGQPKAPAWFNPTTNTVTIDTTVGLAGVDPADVNPLTPAGRRRHPVIVGLAAHEAAHAQHTRWAPSFGQGASPVVKAAAVLLEEPRVEARHLSRRPQDRPYLRAQSVLLDVASLGSGERVQGLVRARAAEVALLTLGRVDAGVLEPEDGAVVETHLRAALGDSLDEFRVLWREAIALADRDVKGLMGVAQRWVLLLGDVPAGYVPSACGIESAGLSIPCDDEFVAVVEPSGGGGPAGGLGAGDDGGVTASGGSGGSAPAAPDNGGGAQDEPAPGTGQASDNDSVSEDEKDALSASAGTTAAETPEQPGGEDAGEDASGSDEAATGGAGGEALAADHQDDDAAQGSDGSTGAAPAHGDPSEDSLPSHDALADEAPSSAGDPEGGEHFDDVGADDEPAGGAEDAGDDTEPAGQDADAGDTGESPEDTSGQEGGGAEDPDEDRSSLEIILDAMAAMTTQAAEQGGHEIEADFKNQSGPSDSTPSPASATHQKEHDAKAQAKQMAQKVFSPTPKTAVQKTAAKTGASRRRRVRARETVHATREPRPAERVLARRVRRALEKAQLPDRATERRDMTTPPGRMRGREAMVGAAQRAQRMPVTAKPFTTRVNRYVPAPPIHLGIMVDISGSMTWATDVMSSVAWAFSHAMARLDGTSAAVTFGHDVTAVTAPGQVPKRVTQIEAEGMGHEFRKAFSALDGALNLIDGRGARVLVVVSDGEYPEPEVAGAADAVRRLNRAGGIVVWIDASGRGQIPDGAVTVQVDPMELRAHGADDLTDSIVDELTAQLRTRR